MKEDNDENTNGNYSPNDHDNDDFYDNSYYLEKI